MNKLIALGIAALMAATALPVEAGHPDLTRSEQSAYVPGALAPRYHVGPVVPNPQNTSEDPSHLYLGGTGFLVWCSADDHSLAPIGPAPAINESDMVNTTLDYEGWLFSGEPECAYSDGVNGAREATCDDPDHPTGDCRDHLGLGAAAWQLELSELGGTLESSTNDDTFQPGEQYQAIFSDKCVEDTEYRNDTACPDPSENSQPETDRVRIEGCESLTFDIPENNRHHWQSNPNDPYYLVWTAVYTVGITPGLKICLSSSGLFEATITKA